MIKTNGQLCWLALSFYTRLPCPKNLDYTQLAKAARFLPLVGWMVGGICALVFYLASLLWAQTIALLISLIAGLFVTGAFHEDGLADVADGFGGGWEKAQILAIMKDSRVGTYGALSLVLMVLLKLAALGEFPVASVPLVLMAGHSLSRFQPLWLMHQYDYAREVDSKSGSAMHKPGCTELLFALLTALLPLLLLPMLCFWAVLPVILVNEGLGRYFYKHIGGYTGDCLGAAQQVAEVVFYLAVAALWKFT